MSRNKFQPVDFRDIEDCLDYLPAGERKIMEALRQIIFETIPEITEKLSWNIPVYSRNKSICFIWPSAVPWGKISHAGVRLGFSYGYLITDEFNFMSLGNRKQVTQHDFFSVQEIDISILRSLLLEALVVDDSWPKKKRR